MPGKRSSIERWTPSVFRVYMMFVLILCCGDRRAASTNDLYFSFITSNSGGFASGGSVPAIDIALQQIAMNGSILPDYSLNYTLQDSECNRSLSLDVFFREIQSDPVKIAVLGCGCSVATEPVAEVSHHWNITQISYASSATFFADRIRFRNFFRTHPSDGNSIPAVRSLIEYYGWKRVLVITQMENLFVEFYNRLGEQLDELNVDLENRRFAADGSDLLDTNDLFGQSDDFRVIFLNMYSDQARRVICMAYMKGFTYPRYAWITYGWYQDEWWTAAVTDNDVNCTDAELASFLDRVLAVQNIPAAENLTAPTDTGLTTQQFNDMYESAINQSTEFNFTFVATLTYDAVWALSLALDSTAKMINSALGEAEIRSLTGCNNANGSGTLVPLSEFEYSNALMGCVIRWNLHRVAFQGVSGPVKFGSEDGSRVQDTIRLLQYNNVAERRFIAISNVSVSPPQLMYQPNEDNETVFPDGIPPDGTAISATITYHLALVIIYYILATLGIISALVCLAFTVIFRNRKVVQLTSPKLNYFIVAGTIIAFASIYVRLIPSTNKEVNQVRCSLQGWMSVLGYTLIYGTILSKMGRVYHIFNDPTVQKKTFKDRHLIVLILLIVGVGVLLLLIGTAVPQLRPNLALSENKENPNDRDEFGVRINNSYWQCYGGEENAPSIWLALIFGYLAILQIIGIVLAVQTRKVTVKVLNDSKFIAFLIYVSSIVLVMLVVVTFALDSLININEVLFSGGILIIAVTFLFVVFVPKMYRLYRDPLGEKIFDRADNSSVDVAKSGRITVRRASGEDARIKILTNRVVELESELKKYTTDQNSDRNGSAGGNHTQVVSFCQENGGIDDSQKIDIARLSYASTVHEGTPVTDV